MNGQGRPISNDLPLTSAQVRLVSAEEYAKNKEKINRLQASLHFLNRVNEEGRRNEEKFQQLTEELQRRMDYGDQARELLARVQEVRQASQQVQIPDVAGALASHALRPLRPIAYTGESFISQNSPPSHSTAVIEEVRSPNPRPVENIRHTNTTFPPSGPSRVGQQINIGPPVLPVPYGQQHQSSSFPSEYSNTPRQTGQLHGSISFPQQSVQQRIPVNNQSMGVMNSVRPNSSTGVPFQNPGQVWSLPYRGYQDQPAHASTSFSHPAAASSLAPSILPPIQQIPISGTSTLDGALGQSVRDESTARPQGHHVQGYGATQNHSTSRAGISKAIQDTPASDAPSSVREGLTLTNMIRQTMLSGTRDAPRGQDGQQYRQDIANIQSGASASMPATIPQSYRSHKPTQSSRFSHSQPNSLPSAEQKTSSANQDLSHPFRGKVIPLRYSDGKGRSEWFGYDVDLAGGKPPLREIRGMTLVTAPPGAARSDANSDARPGTSQSQFQVEVNTLQPQYAKPPSLSSRPFSPVAQSAPHSELHAVSSSHGSRAATPASPKNTLRVSPRTPAQADRTRLAKDILRSLRKEIRSQPSLEEGHNASALMMFRLEPETTGLPLSSFGNHQTIIHQSRSSSEEHIRDEIVLPVAPLGQTVPLSTSPEPALSFVSDRVDSEEHILDEIALPVTPFGQAVPLSTSPEPALSFVSDRVDPSPTVETNGPSVASIVDVSCILEPIDSPIGPPVVQDASALENVLYSDAVSPAEELEDVPPPYDIDTISMDVDVSALHPKAKEPLFLPSPVSSPEPRSVGSHQGDIRTGRAASIVYRLRKNRAYVLLPLLPKWARKANSKLSQRQQSRLEAGTVRVDSPDASGWERSMEDDMDGMRQEIEYAVTKSMEVLVERPCHWDGCDVIMNSGNKLVSHVDIHITDVPERRGTVYPCQWTGCQRRFTERFSFVYHVKTHTRSTYYCAFKDCHVELAGRNDLALHHRLHVNGTSKHLPSPVLPRLPKEIGELPRLLPTYMIEARDVRQAPISAERHAVFGPWVLRNIFGPVNVGRKRYNAAVPLRNARRALDKEESPPPEGYKHDEYDFLAPISLPTKIQSMEDLPSADVSRLISAGMIKFVLPRLEEAGSYTSATSRIAFTNENPVYEGYRSGPPVLLTSPTSPHEDNIASMLIREPSSEPEKMVVDQHRWHAMAPTGEEDVVEMML